MATVIGVRYDDQQDQIPPSVEIRMNIDNNGPDTVILDPASMELSNGQLMKFAPAIVRPPTPITIGSNQAAYVTAYFPFPGGSSYDNADLSSLETSLASTDWSAAGGPNRLFQPDSDGVLRFLSLLVLRAAAVLVWRSGDHPSAMTGAIPGHQPAA